MSGMSLCGTPTTPRDQRKAQARASRWSFISSAWEAVVSVSRFLPLPVLHLPGRSLWLESDWENSHECNKDRGSRRLISGQPTAGLSDCWRSQLLRYQLNEMNSMYLCVCEREWTCICYWDRDSENNACEWPCERERLSRQPESRSLRAERVNLKLHLEPYKKNV